MVAKGRPQLNGQKAAVPQLNLPKPVNQPRLRLRLKPKLKRGQPQQVARKPVLRGQPLPRLRRFPPKLRRHKPPLPRLPLRHRQPVAHLPLEHPLRQQRRLLNRLKLKHPLVPPPPVNHQVPFHLAVRDKVADEVAQPVKSHLCRRLQLRRQTPMPTPNRPLPLQKAAAKSAGVVIVPFVVLPAAACPPRLLRRHTPKCRQTPTHASFSVEPIQTHCHSR